MGPAEATHLQLPPQTTFTAADAVHDPGDVLEVEAELLLEENTEHIKPGVETTAGPGPGPGPGLTFSVLASILCPANMDFSSKCMGKVLEERQRSVVRCQMFNIVLTSRLYGSRFWFWFCCQTKVNQHGADPDLRGLLVPGCLT